MTERMLNNRVRKLLEIKEQIKQLEEMQNALETEIKAEFAEGQEELKTEKFLIRWTRYTQNRLDGTKLKNDLPDVYRKYCKAVNGRRFTAA